LLVGILSPRKDDGADFGYIWIQSDGVITHIKIKGCCKSESFQLLLDHAYFGDWTGFSHQPLIYLPKIT
jgi:hypothetical protein